MLLCAFSSFHLCLNTARGHAANPEWTSIQRQSSLLGRLFQLVKEVCCELILPLLEFLLSDADRLQDGDVESVLLALQQVGVEEVDNLATVLPGPRPEDPGAIHGVLSHVVVEQRIEVEVGKTTHLSLQAAHFKLGLIVHLSDELLAVLQLQLELSLLLTVEVGALLHKNELNRYE